MRDSDVQKPPGIAEAIDWLAALSLLGIEHLDAAAVDRTLGSVLKYSEDQEVIRAAGLEQLVRVAVTDFGVETIDLDLPPLVGALEPAPARRRPARHPGALGRLRPGAHARPADHAPAAVLDRPRRVRVRSGAGRGLRRGVLLGLRRSQRERDDLELADDRLADGDRRPTSDRACRVGSRERSPSAQRTADEDEEPAELEVPLALASDEELLGRKSFDALEPHELAQLYRLMSRLELATPLRRTRRYEKGRRGERIDMRRTLRASLRTGRRSDPPRAPAPAHRPPAARAAVRHLRLDGALRARLPAVPDLCRRQRPNAEAFVFATRLTRLTRALASRNPERAIQRAAAAAPDWSSGTRIGDALQEFNDRHGRRGMARGAVIVILSDGWERGDPMLVGREMERLARLAHRIVWVNPRVGAERLLRAVGRHGGRAAALRRARERPQLRGARRGRRSDRGGVVGPGRSPAVEAEEVEPWASATPVPGSSVGMPSGHGPSRGNTTPGWVTDE